MDSMDGWVDGWIDEYMDGCGWMTDGYIDGG